jgi:Tol biopolymer transport system component
VFSPDGASIAFQGYRDGNYHIWTVPTAGGVTRQLTSGLNDDREPAWSRDGTRIAFSSDRAADGNYDIWVLHVQTGQLQRVTSNSANDYMPAWSPRDTAIAFISSRGGGAAVWVVESSSNAATASPAERRYTPAGVTADAPSWGPDGRMAYVTQNRIDVDGAPATSSEIVFPFRASWSSGGLLTYTADGKVKQRTLAGGQPGDARIVEFSIPVTVTRASYTRRPRDVDSRAPRRALGIVAPALSPDGQRIVFAALGDIWLLPVTGGVPQNITRDAHMDTEPAWAPDGNRIAYSSDKGGGFLNLWLRDLRSGEERQLTRLNTSAMGAAWSPDGSRIAFLDVDGLWRRAAVSVVDVATGAVTRIKAPSFGPGTPTWSPDGNRVYVASLVPYSSRFREGLNQILSIPATRDSLGGGERIIAPLLQGGLDSRSGAGPALSPDGRTFALVSGGLITLVPVTPTGAPLGPTVQLEHVHAHNPSWSRDSRFVLIQSGDGMKLLDVEGGGPRDVPVDLTYTPAIPEGRTVVHAGSLVDGIAASPRANVDIIIDANRIARVEPHSEALHAGSRVVDATGLTVMPGLIEYHTHLQKDMGAAHYRSYLAFGITSVRSPGGTPYEAVEDREAIDAGVRPGPRLFVTGYLMEWRRSYYKMSVAIANENHLEMELARARALQFDMLKSYVRMPDLMQRRMVEFAHSIGVPASSHEIFPSAHVGIDGVEHTTGTSRRGYSPKVTAGQRTYSDVTSIIGSARMTFTPTLTLSGTWLQRMIGADTSLRSDERFGLTVPWVRSAATGGRGGGGGGGGAAGGAGAAGQFILAARAAGARIVAGTDTPNPANLHAELAAYVAAGMSPFEALQTATVTPAQALNLDAGSIQPGKLADLVIVAGNPLADISAAYRVRTVVANGRVYNMQELLRR